MNTNNLPHLNPLCTGMGVLSTNSEAALGKFSSLRFEHFQLYARQLCVSVRKAKALLKSDVRYKPQQAILLIDALVDEVNKTKRDFVVGDVVVFKDVVFRNKKQITELLTIVDLMVVNNQDFANLEADKFYIDGFCNELRHATATELKANRRLPKPVSFVGMGDDKHIENHISPLCHNDDRLREKFEKQNPDLDLHYVYAIDEYSNTETQEKWSNFQLKHTGMDLATGQDRTKVFVKSINMTKQELESAYAEVIEANIGVAAINADYLEEKLNLQSRIDEALKIINKPDNMYLMFSQVAGLLTEALIGEVQS